MGKETREEMIPTKFDWKAYDAKMKADIVRQKQAKKPVYTMAQLRAYCKKHHIELDSSYQDYSVYSPKGYNFRATGTHVLVSPHRDVKEWKVIAIQQLMEDMMFGMDKCPKDCEACYYEG